MKIKKTIQEQLNSAIIAFFQGLSTSPFTFENFRMSSIYNNKFEIYKIDNYDKRLQNLACLLLNDEYENMAEIDYTMKTIVTWLQQSLSNTSFFEITEQKKTLFENQNVGTNLDFCKKFEEEMKGLMKANIKERFLIIPVKNFLKYSFNIEKIGYISKCETVNPIVDKLFGVDDSYKKSVLINEMNDPIFEDADGFVYAETHEGLSFFNHSEEYLKKFVTVIISMIQEKPSSIMCSLADPFERGFYFEDFKKIHSESLNNPILPSIMDIEMISFNQNEVEDWFNTFKSLNKDEQERIEICIHLLNNAFCSKKNKKFDDICKGVDALFGIDRKVERTLNGNLRNIVKKYDADEVFLKKIDKLWTLRNKVFHGDVKGITYSEVYLKYKLDYQCCPEDDYLDLSFYCIKHSVDYFKSNSFLDYKENDND